MKSYGQFCPVAKAAEVFCERWTPLILRDLAGGSTRFSELQRGVPLCSPTLLSRRLKQLEAENIVERRRSTSGNAWTYHLTPAGEEFAPLILALGVWGQRWTRRDLEPHEMDLGLLVWAFEKDAHPDAFGGRRCIVQVTFTDQPTHKRNWWYLNKDGACELCIEPPDDDIELHVQADLATLIHIWRGDLTVGQALKAERLELDGAGWARRAFPRWLGIAAIADVKPARAA
ncbi:MAG: helix-turn-helix domain-containing protein [Alphaproteobacteria bacterium]